MCEKAWYQNGWIVFIIVVAALILGSVLYEDWQKSQKAFVVPQVAGGLNQPLFGDPSLELTIWHHHTGDLRNGFLQVSLESSMARNPEGRESKTYSFEAWAPNRENAVTLTLPLSHFDPDQEIPITFFLTSKNMRTFRYQDAWIRDSWKSNRKANQRR